MALLGYSFAFLVLLGIVAWIVFPRLMRFLFIALVVFVGALWLIDATPSSPPAQRQELQR
jgi:hypothetical protein